MAEVGFTLVTAGVVLIAFVAYDLWGTSFAERHDQALLARQFRSAVASAAHQPPGGDSPVVAAPKPTTTTSVLPRKAKRLLAPSHGAEGRPVVAVRLPVPGSGVALARIEIPVIGVDRYVVEGVNEGDLEMGPGHYPGTPMPGQRGNVGIAGHRTTFGAPFFELGRVKSGDMVYLTGTSGWTWGYRVQRSFVVLPTDVSVLDPLPGAELTLTTCNPPFEATTRLIVRAQLLDRFRPGVHVTALPSYEAHGSALAGMALAVGTSTPASTVARSHTHAAAGAKLRHSTSVVETRTRTSQESSSLAVPVPRTGGAEAGAVLWGLAAAALWLLARLLASRVVGRSAPTIGRRRWYQAGTLVLGAAVAAVPLWSCFANIVQLLPPNF